MIKLIAVYIRPSELTEFDRHYDAIHLPLLKRLPGLRGLEITRITGAPIGEAKYYLMAEMKFDTRDTMDAALASKEGKAMTRDLLSFAADLVTVFHGDVIHSHQSEPS
jgi:uncharacterized protein (TIGR02118 family)